MTDASTDPSPAQRGWEHVRRATDELRAAVREYEHAIENDPSEPQNHYQLVEALAMLGEAHDAVARYRDRDTTGKGIFSNSSRSSSRPTRLRRHSSRMAIS